MVIELWEVTVKTKKNSRRANRSRSANVNGILKPLHTVILHILGLALLVTESIRFMIQEWERLPRNILL